MKRLESSLFLAILVCIVAGIAAYAQAEPTFTSIDVPGALGTAHLPQIWIRINAEGEIVGGYEDKNGKGHGFLFSRAGYVTVDGPGAISPNSTQSVLKATFSGITQIAIPISLPFG